MNDLNEFICSNPIILSIVVELITGGIIQILSFSANKLRFYKKIVF